jgi:hypothetical protein
MKKNYFKDSWQWKEEDINTVGLPRPFAFPNRKGMAKKVPIPWQSEDRFESKGHLGLNQTNEDLVFKNNLCSYCGIKINNNEITQRWITAPLELTTHEGPKVFSDFHPLHLECMEEARIFCPHMRKLQDLDFETGEYKELKQNAVNDEIMVKNPNSFSKWFRPVDQNIIEGNSHS